MESNALGSQKKPRFRLSVTNQTFLGLALGILLGWWINTLTPANRDKWDEWISLVRDIFLNLIKAMIAPLVFASIVQGIAATGDLKRVGRMGAKSLLYFEIVTTFALIIGLLVANIAKPGAGVVLSGNVSTLGSVATTKAATFVDTLLNTVPTSLIHAMANDNVLQTVCFAVLFSMAVIAAGEKGKPILVWCESLTQVMFKFASIVMFLAPYGVGAAIASTVGHQGLNVLFSLSKLIFTLYSALALFVVLVFGAVIAIVKIPLKPFFRAVREPFTLAFATANSEAALPKAFENMERFGVPRCSVGFVLPAGYTFNLDGSTLYLAIASVFVAQTAEASIPNFHFSITQQITMMLTLMVTSKGVAAVPRASLVILVAALGSFGLPLEGAAMILGIDSLMDMARTSVNVLGNCLASVVVARWEGEFDYKKALTFSRPDEVKAS